MKFSRESSNAKSRLNPFFNMLRNMVPRTPQGAPFEPSTPEMRADIRRQDRPTSAMGAFDRKYGWKTGMESAAKSDRIGETYRRGQRNWGSENGWMEGDAWTTRKQNAPAGMAKRNKPTTTDALNARRTTAINKEGYFGPEAQRMAEIARMEAARNAKAFERGLEIAKRRK